MKRLLGLWLSLLLLVATAFAQNGKIRGTVVDAETGEPLLGANVVVENTMLGASTDADGYFVINDVPAGTHTVSVNYVGYQDVKERVEVQANLVVTLDLKMKRQVLEGQEITVLADRAKPRETPVAFTDVKKIDIETRLASQDVPMVLNTTPSVYSTMQGGGAGDARLNVRGFNQRNVAIMINGVPVNDMENGWVYWSNWDGLGDASSSIQVQRGLTAVNLATPSIGGTINIITDPSKQQKGIMYKKEIGSGNFEKTSIFAHTGLVDNRWSLSLGVVRKTGAGVVDKTWTDAWAYYMAASYQLNKNNRIEIYAVGAPQRHGQNSYRQNVASYDSSYAKSLDGYDLGGISKYRQSAAGRLYNQNWNSVSPTYTGKQYWDGKTHDRYSPYFINERENYFHKPQVNINWYTQINDKLNIYNVFYYSGGKGGGSGTYGSLIWDYSGPSRIADWDATIAYNDTSSTGSRGILRNSVNNQWTLGFLSKAYYKHSENLTFSAGLDGRIAEIDHFREVRDLLGGDYYIDDASEFWPAGGVKRYLGDKIDYNFTNDVQWLGGYLQGEYKMDQLTAYGTVGLSAIKYKHHNFFVMDPATGEELDVESDWISGFQFKTGANYNIDKNLNVFGNFGYVQKVPIFDNVIDDRDGTKAEDPKNETFISAELGSDFQIIPGVLTARGNIYYTLWNDRAYSRFTIDQNNNEIIVFLTGVNAKHVGFETEIAFQPIKQLRFDIAGSIGRWKYTDDVKGTYKDYSSSDPNVTYELFIKDLNVGDAPQQQFSFITTVYPFKGFKAEFVARHYRYFYADFDPLSRTDANDRAQSWRVPNYSLFDIHLNYDLPFDLNGVKLSAFAHLFNVWDEVYISDALDNSSFNAYGNKNHTADDAEVFLGLPRTFNMGLKIQY
ncbi:MAG: TonB-dependent receptor [Calditrichia bacterium]